MFSVIGVVEQVPAADATPAGALRVSNANTLEISGRVTGGTGVLHLLRRIQLSPTSYHYRPWCEDRPIDPYERADVSGYFSARVRLPDNCANEDLVILNPGGSVTLDGAVPLVARGAVY
jgi:hypothetical protein